MLPLIGLTGKKQAGKDTAAARLIERHGFTRFAYADIMKEFALAIDPIVGLKGLRPLDGFHRLSELVEEVGWERAKELSEVRRVLQALGTEAGRALFGEDFWVDRTFGQIARFHAENGLRNPRPVVITDVRFPNEAQAVRDAGGLLVRVVRPGLVSTDQHPSETALDGVVPDRVLWNDGSVDDLNSQVDALIERN